MFLIRADEKEKRKLYHFLLNCYAVNSLVRGNEGDFSMQTEYHSRPRDEAEERIECYIIENSLQPHDRLPSERDLCKLWGLNRSTLHSAIARLISQGSLYAVAGSGTYISEPKITRNLQDLKSFSSVIEEYGRRLVTKVVSMNVIESNKLISQNLHVTLGYKVLELVRLRIVDDIPVLLEKSYINYQRYPGIEKHDFGRESLYSVLETKYNVSISKGEEKISITSVDKKEAELLSLSEKQAVFSLSGYVLDLSDIPVEYFKSLVRPDSVCFASELTRVDDVL